ncbi:MAG: hypothetical protein WBQ61_04500 [Candidatus Acidiferrum sp.]
MSEEGTEQGGFIWGAGQLPDGSIQNHVHLSFDQYEENQVFAIDAGQAGVEKFSRISVDDQGSYPIDEKRKANEAIEKLPPSERDAAWDKFFATHKSDVRRIELGRSPDGSVGLELRDTDGKVRILLSVRPNGEPILRFMGADGKVVRELVGTGE